MIVMRVGAEVTVMVKIKLQKLLEKNTGGKERSKNPSQNNEK